MASLKDMRVRIASVKATQKITKAMQMVAAAKLRRAQTAAEAARPYAERMEQVISQHCQRSRRFAPARRSLLVGTGKDQVASAAGLHGERGLCGGFNSSIVRLARERALALMQSGQEGQDLLRRPQGLRTAAPHLRQADRRAVSTLRAVKQLGFVNAEGIAKKVIALFEAGEFDVCTLFYSRFKSVISQMPTAQQIIPLVVEAHARRTPAAQTVLRIRAGRRRNPHRLLPRNLATQIFRALLENDASFTARR